MAIEYILCYAQSFTLGAVFASLVFFLMFLFGKIKFA